MLNIVILYFGIGGCGFVYVLLEYYLFLGLEDLMRYSLFNIFYKLFIRYDGRY